jgi:hypothetical protein
MIPKTTSSPIAVPAQAITNSTITAMSDNMYLAFIDLHLAWRLHASDIERKSQISVPGLIDQKDAQLGVNCYWLFGIRI